MAISRGKCDQSLVKDILGIPLRIRELLPPDAKKDGFDTVGAALNVSAVQMESYLKAIDVALDSATTLIERPKTNKWRLSYLHTHGMMVEYRRSGPFYPAKDGLAMFAPDFFSHFNSLLDQYVVPHDARYRVRVSAYAIRTKEPITLTVRMGGPGHKESDEVPKKLLGNVSVKTGEPQVFEFEEYLERGQMFRIYPSSLRKMRFEGKKWWGKQKSYQGPAVVVQWVEVEGPIYGTWPPQSHQRLYKNLSLKPNAGVKDNDDPNKHLNFPPNIIAKPRLTIRKQREKKTGNRFIYDPKQGVGGEKIYRRTRVNQPLHSTLKLFSEHPKKDVKRLLRSFIPVAYRRPVQETEIEPFIKLTHRWLDHGASFEEALRTGYKAVLVSPGFLYHQGGKPFKAGAPKLDDYELAERLSFFLWSSIPDETLLKVAAQGKLHEEKVLQTQVERMLLDPKAERFLENFLGQWLDLRLIDFTSPDSDLYPEHDALLEWSMVQETITFFRELLANNLSVQNVIDSDFAMLNDRLAKHYGIPGVTGITFRKVP